MNALNELILGESVISCSTHTDLGSGIKFIKVGTRLYVNMYTYLALVFRMGRPVDWQNHKETG